MKNLRPGFQGVPEVNEKAGSPQKHRNTGSSTLCRQREAHPRFRAEEEEESMVILMGTCTRVGFGECVWWWGG